MWLQQHVDAKKVDTTAVQDIVRARKAESDVPEHVYVVTGAAIHVMMTQTVIDITVLNRTITFGDGAQAIARQSVIIMCITEFYLLIIPGNICFSASKY